MDDLTPEQWAWVWNRMVISAAAIWVWSAVVVLAWWAWERWRRR